MKQGYFPGVATIGKQIVYIENRNGNSNLKFKQSDTLQAAYEMLERKNIRIDRSRMDCGSFTKEIIETVEENCKIFYIRAQRCGELSHRVKEEKEWETARIGLFDVELCSIDYNPFGGEKTYRYVLSRQKNNTGQTDAFFGDDFTYRAIATSDLTVVESIFNFSSKRKSYYLSSILRKTLDVFRPHPNSKRDIVGS